MDNKEENFEEEYYENDLIQELQDDELDEIEEYEEIEQNYQNNNILNDQIREERNRILKEKLKQLRENKNTENNNLNPNKNNHNITNIKSNNLNNTTKELLGNSSSGTSKAAGEALGKASNAVSNAASGAAKAAGNAASGVAKALGSTLKVLLSNPYFWVVVAILVVVIIIVVFIIAAVNRSNEEENENNNGACTYVVNGTEYSNIKVRLLRCGSSKPIEGESLVDFDKYVLGVAYAETESFSAEAMKVEALAAKSYALSRHDDVGDYIGNGIFEENGQTILQIHNCTQDQVYCDPDVGCWYEGNSTAYTVHSGKKEGKSQYKKGLAPESEIRQTVADIRNKILTNSDGSIYYATYTATNQNAWNDMAKTGSSYPEIVAKHYPAATISTVSCQSAGGVGSCQTSTPIKIGKDEKFNITSFFGYRLKPIANATSYHKGVDLGYITGTPVYAIADGEVLTSTDDYGTGGKAIIIGHDLDDDGKIDYESHNYHLSKREVEKGEQVIGGQEIGKVGNTGASTGSHLHFGIKGSNFIDPAPILIQLREHKSVFDTAEKCISAGGSGAPGVGPYYYNQGDYSGVPYCPGYAKAPTIRSAGCFVGSLSIALANLYGRESSVPDMAAYICTNKSAFRPVGSGTDSNLLYEKDFQELFKFNVETITAGSRTVDNIINYLSQGYRIMVSVKGGKFNTSGHGHYIELEATNGSDIYIYDTGGRERNGWYNKAAIQSEVINHVNTGMWVIKKR